MWQAQHRFKKAIELGQSESFKSFIHYNLASAQYEAKLYNDTKQTLEQVNVDLLNAGTRVKFHYLRALTFQRLGLSQESVRELLGASFLLESVSGATAEKTRRSYEIQIDLGLRAINDLSQLEDLYRDFPNAQLTEPVVCELASRSAKLNYSQPAETYYRVLVERFPNSPHYLEAVEFLLAEQNREVLQRFKTARSRNLPTRLFGIWRSGVYRQTFMGNLGLLVAVIFKGV